MIRIILSFLLAFAATVTQSAGPAAPSDEQIRALIKERIEQRRWATGIVIGITSPQGRRIASHGTLAAGNRRPVDEHTVFEIASLTKVFTALLLADMTREGLVALDRPVATCLPKNVSMPIRDGREITFADLATHTSGLPLRPTNLRTQTALDKYAGYTAAQMYAALNSYAPDRDIGSQFRYSNWGFGLLGHALERCGGKTYATLVSERITAPLRMRETTLYPTADMRQRLASGHDEALRPVPNEGHGVLDPAGSLYSTVYDLMTFLELFIGTKPTPLSSALPILFSVRRPTDDPSTQMALGWRVATRGNQKVIWSAGRADGYRSYMAYDPDAKVGVVGLANAGTNAGVDDIALHTPGSVGATAQAASADSASNAGARPICGAL